MRLKDGVETNPDLTSRGYDVIRPLGSGTFGTTWVARWQGQGPFAVKAIDTTRTQNRKYVGAEVTILRRVRHLNVVRYVTSFTTPDTTYVVMEYAKGGDLSDRIKWQARKKVLFEESDLLGWMVQLLMALECIHGLGIMHRDLKATNVFVAEDGVLKLGDFGIASSSATTTTAAPATTTPRRRGRASTVCGSPYYMAPEVFASSGDLWYTNKVDMWSLGVLLFELMTLEKPFVGRSRAELRSNVVGRRFTMHPSHVQYSDELRGVLGSLLEVDPEVRPSAQELLATPLLLSRLKCLADFLQTRQQPSVPREFTEPVTGCCCTAALDSSSLESSSCTRSSDDSSSTSSADNTKAD